MSKQIQEQQLSDILKAVSDTTRRSLLTQLCQQGPTQVTALAKDYAMSLNAVSKHIKVLEKQGLVIRSTVGRTHLISADLKQVEIMEQWLAQLKSVWELRLDKLKQIIEEDENGR